MSGLHFTIIPYTRFYFLAKMVQLMVKTYLFTNYRVQPSLCKDGTSERKECLASVFSLRSTHAKIMQMYEKSNERGIKENTPKENRSSFSFFIQTLSFYH